MALDARKIITEYFLENPEQKQYYASLPEKEKNAFLLEIVNRALAAEVPQIKTGGEESVDDIQILLEQIVDPILSLGLNTAETIEAINTACTKNPRGEEMLRALPEYLAKKERYKKEREER